MGFIVFILSIALIVCYSRLSSLKNDIGRERKRVDQLMGLVNSIVFEHRKLIDQLAKSEEPTRPVMPVHKESMPEMSPQPVMPEMSPQPFMPEMSPRSVAPEAAPQPVMSVQRQVGQPWATQAPVARLPELPPETPAVTLAVAPAVTPAAAPAETLAATLAETPVETQPQSAVPAATAPLAEASPQKKAPVAAPLPQTAGQPTGHPQFAPPKPADQPTGYPQYTPPKQAAAAHAPAPARPAKPRREFNESWIGRNVFGIAASVLVFVGLLFLGVWAWNNVGEWLKIFMMFAASGVMTALGIVLGHKKQNAFTRILTGCGFGAVFISLFVTHLYFRMLGDIPAYCLLFGWLVAAMVVIRIQQSVYLSIVAHLGVAISICFAYIYMADYSLAFLHIYQYVSIAVIIVGNLLCYRQAYRFGLFLSLGLTIVASCYTLAAPLGPMAWAVASPLFAQFLCASFLSYLLSVSTARMGGAGGTSGAGEAGEAGGAGESGEAGGTGGAEGARLIGPVHVLNKLMWCAMLFISVYLPVMRLAENAPVRFGVNNIASPLLFPILVCAAIVGLHIVTTSFLRRRQKICVPQESISASIMGCAWFALFAALWHSQSHVNFPVFSYMFVPGIIMLLMGRFSSNRAYHRAACVFFGADLLGALAISYGELPRGGVIALAAAYIVFYLSMIVFMRKKLGFGERWERAAVYFAGGVWFMLLSLLWLDGRIIAAPNLVFMFVPGLILLGAGRISRNRAYFWAACVFFGADLASVLTIRFGELPRGGVIALAAGYMVFYLCLIVYLKKKWDFSEALERPAVFFASFVWFAMLVALWIGGHILSSPNLTFLFVPGLLLLGAGAVSKNRAYGLAACGIFATDLLSALLLRYGDLPRGGVIALVAGYIVFFLCVVVFMRKKLNFDELWERGAVFFVCGVWFAMMAMLWLGGYIIATPNLTFMFVPGLLLLGAGAISNNRAYLWSACGFFAADLLSALLIRYGDLPRGGVIALAAMYILSSLCLVVFMRKKLGFGDLWERGAVYFVGGVWLVLLTMLWVGFYVVATPSLAFFLLPGLLLLAARRFSRSTAYRNAANAFFALDLVFMLAVGYRELTSVATVAAAFGYMLLYLAAIWIQWPLWPWPRKKDTSMPARLAAYGVVFASFIGILQSSDLQYKNVILGISLTAISAALFLIRFDGYGHSHGRGRGVGAGVGVGSDVGVGAGAGYEPLRLSMRAMEYLLFAVCTFMVSYAAKPDMLSAILYWSLAVLTATVGFMRVRDVLMKPNLAEQIAICLKVTCATLAMINGFAPSLFSAVYVLSLASMVSALICVIIGFISRAKPLRLYGLFLTLICVAKLITYDVRGLETPLRIVALIGGGIICFAISALYSYSENRLIPKDAAAGND